MGMDSKKLSARKKQPGHDRSFVESETNFENALAMILPEDTYKIVYKPKDVLKMFGGRYGIKPEASIEYLPTGRKMYFEVKKQKKDGNAEERACKHHTVQFYKTLAEFTGSDYHAYCTIFCDELATLDRYTVKHTFFFEPGHYFCWVDYDLESLRDFILGLCEKFLIGPVGRSEPVPE